MAQEVQIAKEINSNVAMMVPKKRYIPKKVNVYAKLKIVFGQHIAKSISEWSRTYGVDPYLIASLIVAEHTGIDDKNRVKTVGERLKKNPNYYRGVKSKTGFESFGLMQIRENTFKEIQRRAKKNTVGDTFEEVIANYDKSIKYAALYLSFIKKAYGYKTKEQLAIAYNAGPNSFLLKNPHKELTPDEKITKQVAMEYVYKMKKTYLLIKNAPIKQEYFTKK